MEKAGNTLRSGELAKLSGVSTDALRHYERLGVLARPRRTQAGYRLYPPEALQRVQVVRRAMSVGFRLAELARIFGVRDRGGAPCREVRALAASKLAQIDARMQELLVVRRHLEELIGIWDDRLERTPEGQRAGLLEMLSSSIPPLSGKGINQ
jgi:DNA-binding transcriptional MerR regulator